MGPRGSCLPAGAWVSATPVRPFSPRLTLGLLAWVTMGVASITGRKIGCSCQSIWVINRSVGGRGSAGGARPRHPPTMRPLISKPSGSCSPRKPVGPARGFCVLGQLLGVLPLSANFPLPSYILFAVRENRPSVGNSEAFISLGS